jgi:hypothetical protein
LNFQLTISLLRDLVLLQLLIQITPRRIDYLSGL